MNAPITHPRRPFKRFIVPPCLVAWLVSNPCEQPCDSGCHLLSLGHSQYAEGRRQKAASTAPCYLLTGTGRTPAADYAHSLLRGSLWSIDGSHAVPTGTTFRRQRGRGRAALNHPRGGGIRGGYASPEYPA